MGNYLVIIGLILLFGCVSHQTFYSKFGHNIYITDTNDSVENTEQCYKAVAETYRSQNPYGTPTYTIDRITCNGIKCMCE